jgi:phospho-N-acetylmuramoyl-pentapeptide-transferase
VAFVLGILITPLVTHFLYAHKMWKKKPKSVTLDGQAMPIFNKLHGEKEVGTPRMGGIIIWASVLLTTVLFWGFSSVDGPFFDKLNFLSRNQTWLPIFTLLVGALVGFFDDYLTVVGSHDNKTGGLSLAKRLGLVVVVGLIGAWWFYQKLEVSSIIVPFLGTYDIGWFFIPFFVLVMLGTYSGGIIDGIDGLSGGVFASIFSAYGIIAFAQHQVDLAALSFVVVGALLAFLWFNIPPARFYMTETGIMALTMTLSVIAFLTKQVLVLPLIAFLLVISSLSTILQFLSKRFRGKKLFLIAPLHHHFEALGWPSYKVTMRYWVFGIICATGGVLIALLG